MKKNACLLMLALCVGICTVSESVAQVATDNKATVVFDLRLKRMMDGELLSSLGLGEFVDESPMAGPVKMESLVRVFGAVELPDSAADFGVFNQPSPPEVLPMNFFARIQLADAQSADAMLADMTPGTKEVELNGRMYQQPESDVMTNIVFYKMNDTTIEVGTVDFLMAGTGKEIFSSGLLDAWSLVPDHGIRLAADIQGESTVIAELVEKAKQQEGMNPMGAAYLDLVDNMKSLRVSLDFDAPTLMQVSATGIDQAQAEELRSGLDAVLGMAKMMGKNGMNQGMDDPEVTRVGEEILDSLNATIDGSEVMITIPKPAGFNAVVAKQVEGFKMMFAGGGPGFADPGGDMGQFGDEFGGDFGDGEMIEGGDAFGGDFGDGEMVEGGGDAFGGGPAAGGSDPFGGDEPAGSDPFGGGGAEEPAGAGSDPFGGGGDAGNDPFGGGGDAGSDPFGGGGAEEPAGAAGGDPFGGG